MLRDICGKMQISGTRQYRWLCFKDVQQGYVSIEELLKIFSEKIQLSDISENSRIVEYETCTLTDDCSAYIRKKLPVKSDKDYILK